jgi:outer membrane protein assembly factor BamB
LRQTWVLAACALVGVGCHCGSHKLNGLAPGLAITEPTARDGGEWLIDFGTVPLPGTSTQPIVIENNGLLAGNLLTAALRKGSDPAFSVSVPALPDSIIPGTQLTLNVTYAPTTVGPAVGFVDMTTDDPNLAQATVMLVANSNAAQAQVCVEGTDAGWLCSDPNTQILHIDFGILQVNSSASRKVQVRSVGTAPLDYLGSTLSPSTPASITLSPPQSPVADGGVPVPSATPLGFSIVFAPTAPGAATGVATVTDTDPSQPWVNIEIVGHAVTSMNCAIQVSPTPLNFGSVPNTGPVDQTLLVVNQGAQPCHIASLPITGSAAFSLPTPPTFPDTLQTNGVLTLDVRYTPSGTNVDNGTLTVNSDDPVNPTIAVPLSATSINPPPCVLTATPSAVDFGGLVPGARKVMAVTLTATGTDICGVGVAKIKHGDPAFQVETAMPLAITAAKPGAVNVLYAPTVAGQDGDELDITYVGGVTMGGPLLTLTVPLSGAAGPAQLCIVPTALHYGSVSVGQNKTLSFIMTACGNTNVTVNSITMQPAGVPFALAAPAPTFPINISVGNSVTQGITFTPISANPVTAQAQVASSDPVFPDQIVTLDTNPETPCVLKIVPFSLNFGILSAGVVATKQVSITNVGSGTCNLTNIGLTASAPVSFSLVGAPPSLALTTGQSAQLTVQANLPAGSPTARTGKVTFQSNDLSEPNVTIPLSAFLVAIGPYSQGWPKLYLDNFNTSRTTSDTSSVTGQLLWTFPMKAAPSISLEACPTYALSPVVAADGTIYQVDLFGDIRSIAPDGSLNWEVSGLAPARIDSFGATPFIAADGTIYFTGGSDGAAEPMIYHMSPSGSMLASSSPNANGVDGGADGFDVAPLLGSSGSLFAFDDFPDILLYDANTLSMKQVVQMPQPNGQERGNLALQTDDTSFWNFSGVLRRYTPPPAALNMQWQYPPGGGQAFGGNVYGATVSINPVTGNVIMAAGWGGLTIATGLAAVDAVTGAEVWHRLLPQRPGTSQTNFLSTNACFLFTTDTGNSGPSIANDGTIIVGNVDGMYALDPMSGSTKPGWPYKTASVSGTASIGGDGAIFFGTVDGTFYALNSDGTLRFKMTTGGRISSSPAIGPDGTVYFVSDDGNLYAVH